MTTDYRALCAELAETLEGLSNDCDVETRRAHDIGPILDRASTALAQPGPVGPTDEEIVDLYSAKFEAAGIFDAEDAVPFARTVLQRWGSAGVTPIPVSERLPVAGDCDAEGRCWILRFRRVWDPQFTPTWALVAKNEIRDTDYWLPFHALPLPTP